MAAKCAVISFLHVSSLPLLSKQRYIAMPSLYIACQQSKATS